MSTRTNDESPAQPSDRSTGERSGREQPDAAKGRTADSSPGDPPADRSGTTPPDGANQGSRATDLATETAAAAEPGRGQVRGADPRIDIASADSRPAPDDTTTGSDRDTLKPGV